MSTTTLVIVESPTKVPTIKGFLGKGYKVVSSKGHVRDLPKSKLGIDVEHDFEPKYINIRGKGELINALKKEAKNASKVLLATDPDREGRGHKLASRPPYSGWIRKRRSASPSTS